MADHVSGSASATPGVLRRTVARHGRQHSRGPLATVLRFIAVAVAVALISTFSLISIAAWQVGSAIDTVTLDGPAFVVPPGIGAFEGGFTMLIVGSDECVDTGGCPGRTEKLNDFTMLLHVNANHDEAVALSLPRDMIVPIPSCPGEGTTGNYPALSAQQINVSFSRGGLPCTALTVSALTGLPIQFAGVMTFEGVRQISTAIGGVDVCTTAPIVDAYSGLNLPAAGHYLVQGEQALKFLRTRHGVGDGSDTGRIASQQSFLASMMRKIRSADTLANPVKVYQLATAAAHNMKVSDNLKNVDAFASLALTLRDIPLDKIVFVKYPAGADPNDVNRVIPMKAEAAELMAKIANEESFAPEPSVVGTTTDPNAQPTPSAGPIPSASISPDSAALPLIAGATGQTAADETCSKAFGS